MEVVCQHEKVKFLGLCLVDLDSGFVQQLYECLECGEKGQVPTMFDPKYVSQMKRYSDCYVIKNGVSKRHITAVDAQRKPSA